MRTLLTRLYRGLLILAAALIGGLLIYWFTRNQVQRFGENVAALWSWFLILVCAFVAHRLLPKDDLSQVSRLLLAILASAVASMFSAWVLIVLVDMPFDDGYVGQLLLAGLAALILAAVVFCPIYLMRDKIGRYHTVMYVMFGILIPILWLYFARPFGEGGYSWNVIWASVLTVVGASSALGFMLVAGRKKLQS